MGEQQTQLGDLAQFYKDEDPELNETARVILTQYSGIPEPELASHVRTLRDKAWQVFQYPCIGLYAFLEFSIGRSPHYPNVLERLRDGENLLDQACCFGQDIRKLVHDGAPAEQITGSELEQGFIDLGYELFRDRDRLKTRFITGDFFDPKTTDLEERSYDVIHASAFFHLFSWDEQVEAWIKALRMLKPKAGSMVFGRQTAVKEAGAIQHSATRSGEMYRHNADSFRKLMDEVLEKTGIKLDFEVEGSGKAREHTSATWNLVKFCATLK